VTHVEVETSWPKTKFKSGCLEPKVETSCPNQRLRQVILNQSLRLVVSSQRSNRQKVVICPIIYFKKIIFFSREKQNS